ncbi:hypothetical protein [Herbiconiux sp. L3-i23]|uniref:hypothetical protein n=1 Tax=Herbiconiux sp. L3-i23 TaxID=2905871 RepID=UPI00205161AC|nr:hypothetical protein [Herbiconiux sp. L3-i23]BDI23431.1 hypothetical protein L3i23_22070 [Herbiconiux sp. L3-i23]
MTFQRTAEWDAFGPWILPVTNADDVPRAFRAHPFRFDGGDTIVKVPRNVARRDADPTMHLYDNVLTVNADGLEVLTRDGDSYSTRTIPATSIAAIEHGSDLLDGWFTVYPTEGARVEIRVSGAAGDTVAGLTDRLLDAAAPSDTDGTPSEELRREALPERDVALVNAYRPIARRTSGLTVSAVFSAAAVASTESLLRRLRKGQATRSGAVIATGRSRLVVVTRHHPVSYGPKPDLSLRHIVVLRSALTGASIVPHPSVRDTDLLELAVGADRIVIGLPRDPTKIDTLLADLPLLATGEMEHR